MPDSSRPTRTESLLVVLALLGALALGATTDVPTTAERLARESHLLPLLSLDTLEQIVLSRKGSDETIVLRRADPVDRNAYFLGETGSERADPALLQELLATLDFTSFERRLEALPPDLSKETEAMVSLEVKDDRSTTTVHVLAKTPSSSTQAPQYIVRVTTKDDGPLLGVISARLVEALDLTTAHLRGPELFVAGVEETKRLTFSTPSLGEKVRLSLISDDLGFFASSEDGRTVRADRTRLDVTFFHLAQSTLTEVLAVDDVRKRLEEAAQSIEIRQEVPGETTVVRIGSRCPGDDSAYLAWRVRPRPIAGCVRGGVSPLITPSFDDYVDRTATVLTSDEMDHVEVVWKQERIDILRDGAGFVALHADRTPIDPAAAEDFFGALSKGELVPALPPATELKSVGKVTISGVAPQKALPSPLPGPEPSPEQERQFASRQTLELFLPEKRRPPLTDEGSPLTDEGQRGGPLVRRIDDDTWWVVPARLSWAFQANDTWTRSRQLTSFEPSEVQRVLVITTTESDSPGRLHGGASFDSAMTVQRTADRFVSDGELVDTQRMRHFLDDLTRLQAVRFEAGAASWRRARLMVEWTLESGSRDRLTVGRRVQGGFLGRLASSEDVFVLDLPTVTRLMLPLADRSPAQLAWRDAGAIVFDFLGQRTRLIRSGRDFRVAEGAHGLDLSGALVDALDGWNVLARVTTRQSREAPLLTIEVDATRTMSESDDNGSAATRTVIEVLPRTRLLGMDAYAARVEGESGVFYIESEAVEALFDLL